MILQIIKRIQDDKKLTKRMLKNPKLTKILSTKLEKYQNGSKRLDKDKLIRDLRMLGVLRGGMPEVCNHMNVLGKGSYGCVVKCDDQVAIKFFTNENIKIHVNDFLDKCIEDGNNLVQYTSFTRDQDHISKCQQLRSSSYSYYFLQLCPDGDFRKYEPKDIKILHEHLMHILSSLDWLTSKNIIHGDLKMENILISKQNTPLLHDFDQVILVDDFNNIEYETFTPYYISPFLLCNAKYSEAKNKQDVKSSEILNWYFKCNNLISPIQNRNDLVSKFVKMLNGDESSPPSTPVSPATPFSLPNSTTSPKSPASPSQFSLNGKVLKDLTASYYIGYEYDQIMTLLMAPDGDINLKKQNMLKNDFYALGVIIYQLIYKLKLMSMKEGSLVQDKKTVQLYVDNVLMHMMVFCIIPFYYDKSNSLETFSHGKFISYALRRFCEESKDDDEAFYEEVSQYKWIHSDEDDVMNDIYTFMFQGRNGSKGQRGGKKRPLPLLKLNVNVQTSTPQSIPEEYQQSASKSMLDKIFVKNVVNPKK